MPTQILQQHSGTACSASSSCCQTGRQTSRPERLRLLALAETARLEACLDSLHARHILPSWTLLRGPESGLVMVRGRIGGQGQPFNVGEALVTRCCISLAAGCETSRQADASQTCGIPASDASASDTAAILGCGYVLGEKPRHAEMMAVLDALWQKEATAAILDTELLPELCSSLRARYEADSAAAAATKVDFFTLVRGEDKD